MSTIYSYDLNGKKLSFANWVSNLSPEETPFCSMTGKEKVNQTMFQWQTDYLKPSGQNAKVEGHAAAVETLHSTQVHHNYTQILRKVVKVSDTADSIANYGRGEELFYQTEKASKELKRDLEWAFLNNTKAEVGSGDTARVTAGIQGLTAGHEQADPATGAVVHSDYFGPDPDYHDIEGMMYNLYLAGSQANTIMYHPSHAAFFSSLQEMNDSINDVVTTNRVRLFEHTDKLDLHVDEIISPWCQRFKLVPNRWMPKDAVYFFNPKDFTQMVLREPKRTNMAKAGSSEKVLLEMEAGLRLTNPYAVGVLKESDHFKRKKREILERKRVNNIIISSVIAVPVGAVLFASAFIKDLLTRLPADDNTVDFTVYKDGNVILRKNGVPTNSEMNITIHNAFSASDAGVYKIVADSLSYYDDEFEFEVIVDKKSAVVCTDGESIRRITANGLNLKDSSASTVVTKGHGFEISVDVNDTAYNGTAYLVKANMDGSSKTVQSKPLNSGNATFSLTNLQDRDVGEYSVIISVGTCTQRSNTLILNVQEPTVKYPFKPNTLSVGGWLLQDGVNMTTVDIAKSGDDIEIIYELYDEYAGMNVELVTSLWEKALHTRKGIAGKDIYSVAFNISEESQFMLRVIDGDKIHLSPSFSVKLYEPVTPTPPPVPPVTNLFDAKNSYIGGSCLDDDDSLIISQLPQITMSSSSFFVITEYDATGAGSTYEIFDTASTTHSFTLNLTRSDPAGSGYTYRYFNIPSFKLGDAAKYVLRAKKGSNVQDSKPFTISFGNISNLIP